MSVADSRHADWRDRIQQMVDGFAEVASSGEKMAQEQRDVYSCPPIFSSHSPNPTSSPSVFGSVRVIKKGPGPDQSTVRADFVKDSALDEKNILRIPVDHPWSPVQSQSQSATEPLLRPRSADQREASTQQSSSKPSSTTFGDFSESFRDATRHVEFADIRATANSVFSSVAAPVSGIQSGVQRQPQAISLSSALSEKEERDEGMLSNYDFAERQLRGIDRMGNIAEPIARPPPQLALF